MKILILLRRLGLDLDENQANEEGWLTTSAPHRGDKHPSFAVNIKHGGWKDNATGESGDIIALVVLVQGCTFSEAKQFVDGPNAQTIKPKPKGYYRSLESPFCDSKRKAWLKVAQDELATKRSPLLPVIEEYDVLSVETL